MILNKNTSNKKPFYKKYKIISFPVLLLIILASIFSFSKVNPKPDTASDIVIRKAAADQLYRQTNIKKRPHDLTDEDFEKITELSIIPSMGSGGSFYWTNNPALKTGELADIQLLRKFMNLQKLYLENISVPKKNIAKWKKILAKFGFTDLSETLSIDLNSLKNLSNLETLSLSGSQINNIKSLSGLINLKKLFLSNTGLSNLEPIRGLTSLQELNLDNTDISNLEPIKELVNLKHLNFYCTEVSELEPIKGLTKLETLGLCSTKITVLEPVRNFTNLYNLDISSTQVSNLEPIKNLTNLQYLNLISTQVSDLEPIRKLSNLEILQIGETHVSDFEPIKEFKQLEYIYMENCMKISEKQTKDLQMALPNLKITNNAID